MATALSALRESLALKMRTRSVSGTATGGSTTAVADTGRDEEDDYWNKAWVTVTDTSGSDIETREVNDFANSTGQMDVLRAFSFTVASGDTYELHQKLSVDELNEAINSAIRRARGKIFTKNSATTTSSASTYDYTLSTAATRVYRVELQADTSTSTYPYYKQRKWRLRDGASTPTLEFDEEIDGGYTIRYYYLTEESELTADSASTSLPLDYIYAAARSECYEILSSEAEDDNEFRRYMTKADDWDKKAERLLRRYAKQVPAGRVFKESQWLGGEGWHEVVYDKGDLA